MTTWAASSCTASRPTSAASRNRPSPRRRGRSTTARPAAASSRQKTRSTSSARAQAHCGPRTCRHAWVMLALAPALRPAVAVLRLPALALRPAAAGSTHATCRPRAVRTSCPRRRSCVRAQHTALQHRQRPRRSCAWAGRCRARPAWADTRCSQCFSVERSSRCGRGDAERERDGCFPLGDAPICLTAAGALPDTARGERVQRGLCGVRERLGRPADLRCTAHQVGAPPGARVCRGDRGAASPCSGAAAPRTASLATWMSPCPAAGPGLTSAAARDGAAARHAVGDVAADTRHRDPAAGLPFRFQAGRV